jgi:hypothetical protein
MAFSDLNSGGGFGSIGGGFSNLTQPKYGKNKIDLTSSEGLYNLAQSKGGPIAKKADEILGKDKSLFTKAKETLGKGLLTTLDIIQRPNFAVASGVKNIMDTDPTTTFASGLKTGISGETKHTFTDVFSEVGWNPDTFGGKFAKGAAGFALDVLLDPTTYITFGVGAGAKVVVRGAEKPLSKVGMALLKKGVARESAKVFGEQFVKDAIGNMATKSPELYQKFIDQGGIKFFGNTLISGGRIAGVAKAIPGMTKLDKATEPLRNKLGALFNRNISAKFGKLPREWVQLDQKFRDLGYVRGEEALNKVIKIAQANKLTEPEARMITDAIEAKLPLADNRLENARKQIQGSLGKNLRDEQIAGIKVNELPNYVPHMLLDTDVKNIPFKPTGVRVSTPFTKGRTLQKITGESGETFIGNPRNFVKTTLDEIIEKTTGDLQQKATALAKEADDWFEELVARDIQKPGNIPAFSKKGIALENRLEKILEEINNQNLDVANRMRQLKPKDLFTKGGDLYNVEQATIDEINQKFGKEFFDPNIINTAGIRSVASARAVTAKEFLTEAAQKFGVKASEAPTGYVEAGAKELAGLKFHPAIAEAIDKFGKNFTSDEATNELLRAFDKMQGLWKASVTSLFPAFHGRNAISNVFLNFLDIGSSALSPAKHLLSTVLLKDNAVASKLEKEILAGGETGKLAKEQLKILLDKPVLTDDLGKKWTFGMLRKEIKNNRVAFGDEFTGFLDIRETVKEKLSGAVKTGDKVKQFAKNVNPFSQENIAFKAGRKVGNAIEQQARILNFLANLERTGDVVQSAARTKQFLFDYTNLSEFEKNVLRRLIPFYTFMRKNLELQVTQLAKQPGKLATQAKLFTNISKGLSGSSLSEDELKKLPNFLQQGLGIVVKRQGNKISIINSFGTPIESIFSSLQPNQILGSMTPIIAVPLQAAIGKSFFFDKDLKDVNSATAYKNAPQFIKDYIGFTVRKNKDGTDRYIALNPTRLFILNNLPPSSRVISTIGQLEAENVSGKLKLLRQLTGLKPYGEDLTLQEQIVEKEKVRELQDLLAETGVAPIFRRSFIPKQ